MTSLDTWNRMADGEAIAEVLACCGSAAFAGQLVASRPFADADALLVAADEIWWRLDEQDWREAFACHPRIGEPPRDSEDRFSSWSAQEQSQVHSSGQALLNSIAEKNREYESRHGFLYVVCASGRSAQELLDILGLRLATSTATEIREAAEQQRQITHIRIRKWLSL